MGGGLKLSGLAARAVEYGERGEGREVLERAKLTVLFGQAGVDTQYYEVTRKTFVSGKEGTSGRDSPCSG